jgi:hypothetical protein
VPTWAADEGSYDRAFAKNAKALQQLQTKYRQFARLLLLAQVPSSSGGVVFAMTGKGCGFLGFDAKRKDVRCHRYPAHMCSATVHVPT